MKTTLPTREELFRVTKIAMTKYARALKRLAKR